MATFDLYADLPLTERPGLSQGGQASYREAGPLTKRPGLSQGCLASHRKAGPLSGRPLPLTGRRGLLQGGRASYREAGPLLQIIFVFAGIIVTIGHNNYEFYLVREKFIFGFSSYKPMSLVRIARKRYLQEFFYKLPISAITIKKN